MEIKNVASETFSGVIGLYQKDQTLLEMPYGFRDLPNQLENNRETLFGTASAGKAFVAVGIMTLIEAGSIQLTSTLAELLPDDLGVVDREITIYELLTHTSTIQDYFDESIMEDYDELWQDFPNYRIRQNHDLYPLFIHKPVNPANRGKFQYNNSGFVMLASVIEAVTDKPFDEYLQVAVFEPAGMTRTGYYELDRLPANTASAYCFDEKTQAYYTNIYSVDVKGTGAGGCLTTVGDVRRFWQALLNDRLVSAVSREQMFTQQATNGEEIYGLGFWLTELNGQLVPYFEGMDPGICFFSLYDVTREVNVIAISNKTDNVWQIGMDFFKQV
ncbi:serine hydrolase domain-containing protein [uncultured Vagococcus sp.]|uniref:serine hydrolase domain-containing protein n=1 Tax=uncultured Vagococcus sp. TaxID=189676 RepID=UPI0028D76841|nr:serine hydrolase domain-containing protein [uncultured Vagococcus sp.]